MFSFLKKKTVRAGKSKAGHFLNEFSFFPQEIEADKISETALWGFMTWEAYLAYKQRTDSEDNYVETVTYRYEDCETRSGMCRFLCDLSKADCIQPLLNDKKCQYALKMSFNPKDSFVGMQTLQNGIPVFGVLRTSKKRYYADCLVLIYYDGEKLRTYTPLKGNTVIPQGRKNLIYPNAKIPFFAKRKAEIQQDRKQAIQTIRYAGYNPFYFGYQEDGGGIFWEGIKEDAEQTFIPKISVVTMQKKELSFKKRLLSSLHWKKWDSLKKKTACAMKTKVC